MKPYSLTRRLVVTVLLVELLLAAAATGLALYVSVGAGWPRPSGWSRQDTVP